MDKYALLDQIRTFLDLNKHNKTDNDYKQVLIIFQNLINIINEKDGTVLMSTLTKTRSLIETISSLGRFSAIYWGFFLRIVDENLRG